MEAQWRRKDGKIITVRLSGRSILEQGSTVGFEMIVEDITERRLLEDQLRQSQKMEAVGQLAGGVAHDFNNLLTVIKGNTQLLLEKVEPGDPRRSGLEQIQKAADRAASLTSQLLAFSRKQVVAFRVLDLNGVLSNMVQLLHRLLGEHIELRVMNAQNLGRVKADPGQIEQIVMNLALNARDAMPEGGRLTIETANVMLDRGFDAQHVTVKPGAYVLLSVSDTGNGIPPEVLPHVFEPFFTTKPQGKGTGLGLSTVYGIVKQSNGYIWASSEGQGATFKVYLPRVDQPVDRVEMPIQTPGELRGTETVLLVEDEEGVRSLIELMLQKNGYTVVEACSAEEALDFAQNDSTPVHLLLTDIVLPRMTGRELSEKIAALRPGIKTLFMSGYTDDDIIKSGVLDSKAAFLQKPFSRESLLQKVREVLGRAAAAR
jgi:signal transduction histidine kinase/ActR/RegA family two-component response regulator